ncbi:hypothetical protein L0337_07450 [candidate division KSB1 bacterium]|nr:hypothetical protein [candidate division KSB1 bacterium]
MKPKSSILAALFCAISLVSSSVFSQDVTVVAPSSEAAEGLDLQAVAELFKDAKDLEEFEKSLNDPDIGVNNLDLDDNGEVDFIRVMEEAADDAHVIVLQVPLGENEFQDVATIEVEKNGEEDYNMQVRGNEVIYGADYYIAPVQVHVHTWPIIPWIFRPVYHPYCSASYFGFYPRWWHPWHPVTVHVYRTRTVRFTTRATFHVTHTTRVTRVTKVNYHASSSTLVKKQTRVTHGGDRTTTVKAGKVEVHNPKTGKETTVKGVKKTTKTEHGKKTTVKAKKTTRDKPKN